ncbi:hypothetical protein NQD34_001270 [Periophthalmus magnuspinnatus]|nr:hypothetical protein NQD34_001270 [Periophthalmus magnuspinnatus]
MSTPFKIPRRAPSDSDLVQMTSPLSRLQSPADPLKSFSSFRDRTVSGNSSDIHRGTKSLKVQLKSRIGPKTTEPFSNGWRPKRASDRFLSPLSSVSSIDVKNDTSLDSPSKNSSLSDLSTLRPIAMLSLDPLGVTHGSSPANRKCPKTQELPNKEKSHFSWSKASSAPTPSTSDKPPPGPKQVTKQSSWSELSDVREKQREKWRQFKEKKQSRSHIRTQRIQDQSRTRTRTRASSEPIVLSSEEEEAEQSDIIRTSLSEGLEQTQVVAPSLSSSSLPHSSTPSPSFLQLDFCSFHLGLSRAQANGKIMITESGITIPLKGHGPSLCPGLSPSPDPRSSVELCVVASQVRAFGLWDGGVARGGTLFSDYANYPSGPAPSLLFLWITDAQSKLVQTELSEVQEQGTDPGCCLVLLVLREQLSDLDSALVLSILDSGDYRKSRSRPESGPLDWSQGLVLVHTCPSPIDSHLLQLLGQKEAKDNQVRCPPTVSLCLCCRLMQYPAAPSKGRISVSSEDVLCLSPGQFLNDVIIDFYLKYLLLEGVGGAVAEKSHVFSSFFYKQLSKRRAAGEDDVASVPDRHTRHQRVRTWTRNVDIFTKDFLFVPVNQEAHWFLVVVCFPGLEEPKHEDFKPLLVFCFQECTLKGCRKTKVLKRPCLLVMDSLKLSYHETVCRLLRDYLQVEWEVRRGSRRLFSSDSVKSSNCKVPQQDNSSDCGVYLLQYAQSFLQNPVVNFDLPVRLDTWFPRQQVRNKREEIRSLVLRLHQDQGLNQD